MRADRRDREITTEIAVVVVMMMVVMVVVMVVMVMMVLSQLHRSRRLVGARRVISLQQSDSVRNRIKQIPVTCSRGNLI
jgi:high-affinity Fe2+/Pb2+ permease